MPTSTPKTAYFAGLRDGAPFVLVAAPFALLFGVLAAEAGLNVLEVMSFSAIIIAGAAQFTALQLMVENTPTLIVIFSALAVNLRVAMYSAALTPYLGKAPLWQRACAAFLLVDQAFALSHGRFETRPEMSVPARMAYYFGSCTLVMIAWFACTYAGAIAGTQLPESLPLDFALPLAFLSMIGPLLRTLPHVVAAFVATCVSLLAAGLPFSLGLLVGGIAGMVAGAQCEVWLSKRMDTGQTS
jgi:predicted branched-subunit amino acid permease